jgi:hypothetical protein
VGPFSVYAGQVPNDPDERRVVIQARVKESNARRLDAIAAEHPGWTPSDALRHLLVLGLAAYDRPRPAPTPPPDDDFDARYAKLNRNRKTRPSTP